MERFCVPGPGSAGPDLRSQGSSGKDRLSRCARGKVLIASNARFGRVPLPPVSSVESSAGNAIIQKSEQGLPSDGCP